MKVKMDKYFLEETCPFTKRRKVKWKNVKFGGAALVALTIVALLAVTPDSDKQKADRSDSPTATAGRDSLDEQQNRSSQDDPFKDGSRTATAKPPKQYTASQIVRRQESGNSGDALPMGSTIPAKLVNSVLSTDSNSPVIAEIAEEVYWKGGVIIPSGTRAIGQGTLDDATERLQVRFHTLVFPEGDQHSISALALLADGSSGIAGDFHSRTFKKQAGRFFGNFVGGLAQGMKDKEAKGQAGIAFEPGSLKNGLLNGVASSSFDQAKSYSDDAEHLKPYLDVPGGTIFVLYLEKEFSL
jgi:hypothetical protein